jgi:hypothetical protein
MNLSFTHRAAERKDIFVLKPLMAAAIRELLAEFLPADAVAASFAVTGLDTQLIDGIGVPLVRMAKPISRRP